MNTTDEYITRMLNGEVSKNFLVVAIHDIEEYHRDNPYPENSQHPLDYDWRPLLEKLQSLSTLKE